MSFGKMPETEHSGRQFCWLVLDIEPHIGLLVDLCGKIGKAISEQDKLLRQ